MNECMLCSCGCNSIAANKCDCCVKPMENLLNQLNNLLANTGTISLLLVNSLQVQFQKQNIIEIKDGVITGIDSISGNITSVSICEISRVAINNNPPLTVDQINLLPAPSCTCGECDCCEKAVREKLETYTQGTNLTIGFIPDTIANQVYEKVGLGIVLITDINNELAAYSTCKITNIAKN